MKTSELQTNGDVSHLVLDFFWKVVDQTCLIRKVVGVIGLVSSNHFLKRKKMDYNCTRYYYFARWWRGLRSRRTVIRLQQSVWYRLSQNSLREAYKSTGINPYIINWIISFLENRKQRVVIDGITTKYLDINRGVPQGTVLGPVLFSLMVNDIRLVHPENNSIAKYADDITIIVPVKTNSDTALVEIRNIESWATKKMSLNFSKTCEMLISTSQYHSKKLEPHLLAQALTLGVKGLRPVYTGDCHVS